MTFQDNIGDRMKNNYENISKTKLMRRTPVALRLDGKAFHSFTRGFEKPFDDILVTSMQETMKYLCENIQGCVFGYTQSDEITLILIDYKKLTSSAWFDYEVQKICSIASSMATMVFNRFFFEAVSDWYWKDPLVTNLKLPLKETQKEKYDKAIEKGAMFDCRAFNIPKEEVANLIYWRQLDAIRNSIQMVGQANFSHKELQGKSCENIKEMLVEKDIFYENDFPIYLQRGSACRKGEKGWDIDLNMPIIKEERTYIENLIYM
jgi:tRNA(His) 5'-end guanylyltransferase